MRSLFLLQFTSFIFMVINAMIIGMSYIHTKWINKRYERSRWLIFTALLGFAVQYLIQMAYGIRALGDDLGAVLNTLIYTPCFTLMALGIYNIEAPHTHFKQMHIVCGINYAVIWCIFALGYYLSGSIHIGNWLYVMVVVYVFNTIYCVAKIGIEIKRRRQMLETMTAIDILPYVRYAHSSLFILFTAAIIMPFAILATRMLFIVGPLAMVAVLFFNLTFVALGNSYMPSYELLEKEEERMREEVEATSSSAEHDNNGSTNGVKGMDNSQGAMTADQQAIIKAKLNEWCQKRGYSNSGANMMTLANAIDVSKEELTRYFVQCLGSTFRMWLSNIRFEAAKEMMISYPQYNNDIISTECGFSSRTHLYRVFKQRIDCTPTAWREKMQERVQE